MTNTPLSTITPPPSSNTRVFPLDWEADPSVHAATLHDHGKSHSSRTAAVLEVCGSECTVAEPDMQNAPLDFGWWLFHDSSERVAGWEHIRDTRKEFLEAFAPQHRYASSVVKHICDVVGSLLLLVALFPLFLLIAILIKLDSPGPVFFQHDRVGIGGRHFVLWKFRSMRTDVSRYEVSPRSAKDDRLTRVGRLIRRLSLDELPQLINVLKGDMSLVGPRPEMPFIVAQYRPAEFARLAARPGITGLWQISPARAFPIHENLQYDLHYIRNQNFFLDCAILLRTITAVMYGIGAV